MKAPLFLLGLICLALNLSSQSQTKVISDFEQLVDKTDSITVFGNYYMNGKAREVVCNPNFNHINSSTNVLRYTKASNARMDAGFSFELQDQALYSSTYEICIDYLATNQGQCKIVLNSMKDPSSDANLLTYTTAGEWETLCKSINYLSKQDQSYNPFYQQLRTQIISFYPDFGSWGLGTEQEYFIDNIRVNYISDISEVHFQVDMNNYPNPFSQVYVSGSFNGWSGNSHPLSDKDNDGVWERMIHIEEDYIEYIYSIDGWTEHEVFDEDLGCISTTEDGEGGYYRNRYAFTDANTELEPNCYNHCKTCPKTYTLEWHINMSEEIVDEEGVYLAGGAFGHGEYRMTDPDGDGIYSLSMEVEEGFHSYYTYLNGLCPSGWSCKEDLSGQVCGDADNYFDRYLSPVYGYRKMEACFGYCSSKAFCYEEELYAVTFNLDTDNSDSESTYYLAGNTINNWYSRKHILEDLDNDGIYSITVMLHPGDHQYKFIKDKEWEQLAKNSDCTITDDTGMYTNRLVSVVDSELNLAAVLMNECHGFTSAVEELTQEKIELYPTLASDFVYIDLESFHYNEDIILAIYSMDGRLIESQNLTGGIVTNTDVSHYNSGSYLFSFHTIDGVQTERIVVR